MLDLEMDQARRNQYQQRRKVELLRQQLYAQPDPSSSVQLLETLMDAEAELYRIEQKCLARAPDTTQGVLLDTGGNGQKPGGIMLGPDTAGIDAQVLLRQSHIPTGIVHLMHAKDAPLVTFRIQYTGNKEIRLCLTSFVEGYSAQAIDTVELSYGDSIEVPQLPTFFPDRIACITELTRATLHIRVDDLVGSTWLQSTFPVWLLSRTSAYRGVVDPATGSWVDLLPYLGAWVTPNAPAVMELLREAAQRHPNQRIVGYQVDASGVEAQVKAIFEAVKTQGIVYVSSCLSFGAMPGEYTQRVRLPRESIEHKSANCIDGTVMMASLLEAATLNPGLVLVPGHAFLAWETQDGSDRWDYLETTMIGTHDFQAAHNAGQTMAGRQQALAAQLKDPQRFRLLSLPDLRVRRGITPME